MTTKLAYIILKDDDEEVFLSYGYDEQNSKSLYSYAKERIPNAVTSTSFKKRYFYILNERRDKEEFSTLFYYLPLTTNRKEKINQSRKNLNLNPIDCSFEFLNLFSSDESFKFSNHMAKVNNDKLIRNANHLLVKNTNINTTDMQWAASSK